MEYIIGWAIVVLGLLVVGIIVGKKFGFLANIDVNQVAGERARVLKQQIIADRLRRRLSKWGFLFIRSVKPISRLLRNGFDWFYDRLNDWQRSQANREASLNQQIGKRIETLLAEAEELVKAERLEMAEKKYIEIIGLDPRNFNAFKELGEVYYQLELWNEAKQTLEHALHLRRPSSAGEPSSKDLELAQLHFILANVYEGADELGKAVMALKKALKIEENNPRYLDRLIEVSIIKKDKIVALEAYKKLESTNPENQKLEQFRSRIAEL